MTRLLIRANILNQLKDARGIATDQAMADIGHVSLATYQSYRDRQAGVSSEFIARMCLAFSLRPGELAELDPHATAI